jgi:hypothetical protein
MKELRLPWLNWNSVAQEIPLESFPLDHPVRTDPPFAARQSADILERRVVRPAVQRWTRARLDRTFAESGGIAAPRELVQHLLTTTTVNIASSEERSRGSKPEFGLPPTFFLDVETIVNQLGLEITGLGQAFQVRRPFYERALVAVGVALKDSDSGFRQDGDAFFAWPVPERAFEDCVVVAELVRRGVLSAGLALALLMVDPWNPIDSPQRARLIAYVPASRTAAAELEPAIRAALRRRRPGCRRTRPKASRPAISRSTRPRCGRAPQARSTPTWRRCGPGSAPPRAWSPTCVSRTGAAARSASAGSRNSTSRCRSARPALTRRPSR